jgi:hypothetical protein
MAIIAPFSKHKKGNLKIFIVVLLVAGIWFAYDGYFSKNFKEEHTQADGTMDGTLNFNRKSPPFFVGGAVILGVILFLIKDKKLTLDEEILTDGKQTVKFDVIEKIDKTHFKEKGWFTLYYKDSSGSEKQWKITDSKYDNLAPVLDELVAKISE